MKINIEANTHLAKQSTASQQQPDVCFDRLLSFHEKGNYYWQHQSQLQPSALTFHSVINPTDAKPLLNNPTIEDAAIPIVETEDASSITYLSMKIEKNIDLSMSLPKLNIDQFIAHMKTNTECKGYPLNHTVLNDVQRQTQAHSIPKHSAAPAVTFKHYQVFTDASQQVEIALNINPLSKPQLNQLKTFIQQYLSQKGYRLKQLMINGVKQ